MDDKSVSRRTTISVARRYVRRALRQWLPYVLLGAGINVFAVVLGMAVGTGNGASTMVPITERGTRFTAPSAPSLFAHNVVISLQIAAGAVLGGLPTVYLLGFNGFMLGHVVADAAGRFGVLTTLGLIAPHGVFELPAVWLAGAASFRWVHVLWRIATATSRRQPVAITLLETMGLLVLCVLLLGVAAYVESSITIGIAEILSTTFHALSRENAVLELVLT